MKPKVLFIHGGPGMDCGYFKPWFAPLEERYDLIYYNQAGDSLDALKAELIAILHDQGRCHVLAHSWGAHLVLASLIAKKTVWENIRTLTLVTPMALTYAENVQGFKRLQSQMDPAIAVRSAALWLEDTALSKGDEFLALVTPYYHHEKTFNLGKDLHFNRAIFQPVHEEIFGYDIRHALKKLPARTQVIYGASDFIQPEKEYYHYIDRCDMHVIPKAGHYPFAEQNAEFLKIFEEFMKRSS